MKKIVLFILIYTMVVFLQFGAGKNWKWEQKKVKAVRSTEKIVIDGKLNDKIWNGNSVSGFTQIDPDDGKAPTEKTEVWLAYDDNAIYVAAKMFDSDPNKIIGLLARRDEFVDADYFVLSIDPYYDKRSGFKFAVNPSGSIVDWTLLNDDWDDQSWDGVWEAKTKVDKNGWSCEMRIPFDQLRFKKSADGQYLWGVNFKRYIRRKNEVVIYSWKPKTESGTVSRFAELEGISGIKPKKLFEMIPYTIGKSEFSPKEEGNPFQTGSNYSADGGVDIKYGITSSLTLDLTVNPDFGQVEVDPASINLSAAENYYSERRPFFIEGANIFSFGRGGSNSNWGANWGNPRFFYSRRIGRSPQGGVDSDGYVRYPDWTSILTAAKVSGKIGKGWNLGFLTALTEREYASVNLEGKNSEIEVEPFSSYSILRVNKQFNEGRQGLGFIATSLSRDLKSTDIQDSLNKNAFSFGIDGWAFLDKKKVWVMTGWLGSSNISGTKERINDVQNSYPHYLQRPGVDHLGVEENVTSLSGYSGRFALNKQNGNFSFNTAIGFISPGFDSTDMGFQWNGDVVNWHIMAGYRSYKKWGLIKNWSINALTQRNYDFGWNLIGDQRLILISNITFTNYWSVYGQMSHNPEVLDKEKTRGGPMMKRQDYTWFDWGINSDRRKSMVFSFGGYHRISNWGNKTNSMNLSLKWKPGSKFNVTVSSSYRLGKEDSQWITNLEDSVKTETYGTRYIFGELDQKTLSFSIRLNWIFSPKLSLQAYIQPYISVGAYNRFKELAMPKTYAFNVYGEEDSQISNSEDGYNIVPGDGGDSFSIDNPDFNYKSLRGTVVLRWEYITGSALYLVWTQNRSDYENPGSFDFGRDFSGMVKAPGDNIFMLKFTYRFKI